ncbi:ribonuclease Z [Paenibacillus sp. GCM10027626]|uniref:ribonuclease Z n=1 Tax=Paenibacillus sp. GCM10027626 TaxID=3273411 RepID=UPI003629222A
MKFLFLGTCAGRPSKERNVTSAALVLPEPANGFWLFDAGEATQHRLMETKLKLNKLEKIFITHLHGDHLHGLPGLLSSRSYFEGAGALELYGPAGIKGYLEAVFHYTATQLSYELTIVEVEGDRQVVMDDGHYRVTAASLDHRVPCYGYRVEEADRPGRLDAKRLAELGIAPGPLYGRLKRGENAQLPDGRIILASEVVEPDVPGRTVALLGDTRPCENGILLASGADLLVHEATFETGLEEKAYTYGHSTVQQAIDIAKAAKARRLVLTHFSSRYDKQSVAKMIEEGKRQFAEIEAAYDFFERSV